LVYYAWRLGTELEIENEIYRSTDLRHALADVDVMDGLGQLVPNRISIRIDITQSTQ